VERLPGPEGTDHDDDYTLIADHGLIGDLRTSVLVAADGSINWFCAPRFHSLRMFGSIAGSWRRYGSPLRLVYPPLAVLRPTKEAS
jgi:hypothetical protein